jgi:hypothetical protein
MSSMDRRDANLKKLKEADDIQDKTQDAIWRIQRQAVEAEDLGGQTLDELRRQGQQMVRNENIPQLYIRCAPPAMFNLPTRSIHSIPSIPPPHFFVLLLRICVSAYLRRTT